MKRRTFLTTGVALLAAPLAAEAQQTGKVWRIGILTGDSPLYRAGVGLFKQSMGSFGYTEGQNVSFEERFSESGE